MKDELSVARFPKKHDKNCQEHKAVYGESKADSHLRPITACEREEAEKQSSEIVCGPDEPRFPIKELMQYKNKDLVYIVETTMRIIVELRRWIDEEMSGKIVHYYVYNDYPCQRRLIAIDQNMDSLITHLHYYKPELGNTIKILLDQLVRKAKETDKHYKALSSSSHYNKDLFNPVEVKAYAESLAQKLLHLHSMAYRDLKAEKPAGTKEDIAPTKWHKAWTCIKGFVKEAYRITIKSFFDSVMNK